MQVFRFVIADEGDAQQLFHLAQAFADQHERGEERADAGHHPLRAPVQRARPARLHLVHQQAILCAARDLAIGRLQRFQINAFAQQPVVNAIELQKVVWFHSDNLLFLKRIDQKPAWLIRQRLLVFRFVIRVAESCLGSAGPGLL
jgi:hypothetical protein